MSQLIDKLKLALRITTDCFDDDELLPMIEACKADLRLAGVNQWDDADPLIQQAVTLYSKARFGSHEKAERFESAYQALKISMSLAGEYR